MNFNIKFPYKYIFYVFLFSFLNISLYSYAFFNKSLMIFSLIIGVCLVFYFILFFGLSNYSSNSKNLYFSFLFVFTILLPLGVYKSLFTFYFYIASVIGITLAFQLSRFPGVTLYFLKWTLLLSQLIILYYIFSNITVNPYPLEDILDGAGSSNVVTSFLILVQSAYMANLFFLKNKLAWITTIITCLICFLGYGRGSIIAGMGLFFILLLFFCIENRRSKLNFVFFTLFLFFLSVLAVFFMGDIFDFFIENTKLGAGFIDEARRSMISDYFSKMDVFSLLFGVEYNGTVIESYYDGNPHNSFIRAHHLFGIFYLMLIFFVISYSLIFQFNFVNAIFLFLVLIVVNFRAFVEPIIFPTILDFYFFLIVFLSLESSKKLKKL